MTSIPADLRITTSESFANFVRRKGLLTFNFWAFVTFSVLYGSLKGADQMLLVKIISVCNRRAIIFISKCKM